MRIKKYLITCMIIFATTLQANAFDDVGSFVRWIFSIPEPKPAIEKSSPEAFKIATEEATDKLIDINTKTAIPDVTSNEAFLSIVSILSPSDYAQQIKSKLTLVQYDPTLNDTEKSIAISDIISDYQSVIGDNKEAYINKLKNLSTANKKVLTEKLAILSKNGTEYIKLGRISAGTGNKYLSETLAGDNRTPTVDEINSITGKLTQRAQALTYLTRELKNLARQANISL